MLKTNKIGNLYYNINLKQILLGTSDDFTQQLSVTQHVINN